MWLRRDIKYHKFYFYRRSIILKFIILIAFVPICVWWMVHKSDSIGFRSDKSMWWLLRRILSFKTSEEIAFEHEIEVDLSKQISGLCDFGVECFLNAKDEIAFGDASYAKNGINVALSDRISYKRKPPLNVKHELCKKVQFDVLSMPKTSVIITFYEEPYSVLLRTIYSVLSTAPTALLKEIILVDDFSDSRDLTGKLKYYVKTHLPHKVKLLRMTRQ